MWLMFENGTFYSAVNDTYKDKGSLSVRSRDLRSSKILSDFVSDLRGEDADIIRTPHADYLYRVIVTKDEWSQFVLEHIQNAKATNFKSEVAKHKNVPVGFTGALHKVWSAMFDFQTNLEPESGYWKPGKKDKGKTGSTRIASYYGGPDIWSDDEIESGDYYENRAWLDRFHADIR